MHAPVRLALILCGPILGGPILGGLILCGLTLGGLAAPAAAAEVLVLTAPPPSPALAVVTGTGAAALARGETACRLAALGQPCREVLRVREGCYALAHGTRDARLLPFGSDAGLPVSVKTTGTGPTRGGAEREALERCRAGDRAATCRLAAAGCVGGAMVPR